MDTCRLRSSGAEPARPDGSRRALAYPLGLSVIVVRRSLRRLLVVSRLLSLREAPRFQRRQQRRHSAPRRKARWRASRSRRPRSWSRGLRPGTQVRTVYRLPVGVKRGALVKWYKKQLPMGKPFGSWSWCQKTVADTYVQRIWTHPGTRDMLFVELEFPKGSSHPPEIVIDKTDRGPCTTSTRA